MSNNVRAIKSLDLKRLTGTITRPANTTQYAIGDVISDATADAHFTFTEPTRGRTGEIISGTITSTFNQGTLPDIELWLFRKDIADVADNSPFGMTDTEILTSIGVVDFPISNWKIGVPTVGTAGNALCQAFDIGLTFVLGDRATTSLFGQLVIKNTYTPGSAEVFAVSLLVRQDKG